MQHWQHLQLDSIDESHFGTVSEEAKISPWSSKCAFWSTFSCGVVCIEINACTHACMFTYNTVMLACCYARRMWS